MKDGKCTLTETFNASKTKRERVKLVAIIGSQREYGNSFLLTKDVLKDFGEIVYEIIQLAKKKIKFCNLCGKCVSMECPLEDDFNEILAKMREADGIIFAYPKYLFAIPTKLLCFLERLDVISHFRRQKEANYIEERRVEQTFPPPFNEKPCCLFVVADPGEDVENCLSIVADETKNIGLKLVPYDRQLGTHAMGKFRGEVLGDQKGIEDCRKLVKRLIDAITSNF